jgi:hypothetical protein
VDQLGEPVRPYTYSDRFEALCRKACVPVIQLHSVRHTLATIMHKAGQAPAGATAAYPPRDMEYRVREYAAHDLEGCLWSFMTPISPEGDLG